MNDRFKYRYYHEKTNKIYDVCFIDFDCPYVSVYISDEELLHVGKRDFKWENLIQSTGLKDKNGKLIYEGDIVTYDWLTPISKVWRTGDKHIVKWQDGFTVIGNIAGYDVEHGKTRNVEVIGNIYENKDLSECL